MPWWDTNHSGMLALVAPLPQFTPYLEDQGKLNLVPKGRSSFLK